MKKTRNLFILKGAEKDIQYALKFLDFKGMIVIPTSETSEEVIRKKIYDAFSNNKSVLCTCPVPAPFQNIAINIYVVNEHHNNISGELFLNVSSDNIINDFQSIMESLGCDIGDHRSNSSGINGTPSISDCSYCKYLRNIEHESNKCVYRSSNFFVIPTYGELVLGYLLIIPINHIMSLAELNPRYMSEFKYVLSDIMEILKLTYKCSNFLVWENGTGQKGIGKAKDSIVHAHVHIAPSNLTAESIEKYSGFDFNQIKFQDISNYGNHSYLLIKDFSGDDIWKINDNPNLYIPRQYIRQLLAEENGIGGNQWNWRNYRFEDLMHQTSSDIVQALKDNWSKLPVRIRQNTEKFLK